MNVLEKTNLRNLYDLWETIGRDNHLFQTELGFQYVYATKGQWPNRFWQPIGTSINSKNLHQMIANLQREERHMVLPLVQNDPLLSVLKKQNIPELFQQTAMIRAANKTELKGADLEIVIVRTKEEVLEFAQVASLAFGYSIDPDVASVLLGSNTTLLVQGKRKGQVVATGLLHATENTAGIHMVGVHPDFRRQGLAKKMMVHLLNLASNQGVDWITLQASDMAVGLYEQLGFKKQCTMHNYRIGPNGKHSAF